MVFMTTAEPLSDIHKPEEHDGEEDDGMGEVVP